MVPRNDSSKTGSAGHGQRKRLRGMMSGKTGKAIGFTSITAPLLGYVVNDLRKPDSVVRAIISGVIGKLMPPKSEKIEAIDITDKVEIVEDDCDSENEYRSSENGERS